MLRINRLKIEIRTGNGTYGFDTVFSDGLNFIASEDNTCGKSSIIAAIYYCLGLEEIIGGRGEKVLTAAYKTTIEEGENVWSRPHLVDIEKKHLGCKLTSVLYRRQFI